MSVSDVEVCNLAYEGKLVKLQEKIEANKGILHTRDQVVWLSNENNLIFNY